MIKPNTTPTEVKADMMDCCLSLDTNSCDIVLITNEDGVAHDYMITDGGHPVNNELHGVCIEDGVIVTTSLRNPGIYDRYDFKDINFAVARFDLDIQDELL